MKTNRVELKRASINTRHAGFEIGISEVAGRKVE